MNRRGAKAKLSGYIKKGVSKRMHFSDSQVLLWSLFSKWRYHHFVMWIQGVTEERYRVFEECISFGIACPAHGYAFLVTIWNI